MSKLKVDEIEAVSTNQNVKIKAGGPTGALEVKGDTNDGTLQLNCHLQTHGVKLKSPPNSAGQNYTMVLPDNQIAASKVLQVKSVTDNVGQLEFADAPSSTISSIPATGFTSGTVPIDRMPSINAGNLELKGHSIVAMNNQFSQIDFNLDSGSTYHLIGKNIMYGNSGGVQDSQTRIRFANPSGSFMNTYYGIWTGNGDSYSWRTSYSNIDLWGDGSSTTRPHFNFDAIIVTGDGTSNDNNSYRESKSWRYLRGFFTGDLTTKCEVWASYSDTSIIDLIRIQDTNGFTFRQNTEFLLYKFKE